MTEDIYVFDTGSLGTVIQHYYRTVFSSFWEDLQVCIDQERIVSVAEVRSELEKYSEIAMNDSSMTWIGQQSSLFSDLNLEEQSTLTNILDHYANYIDSRQNNLKEYWADPYLIARASCRQGTVISQEKEGAFKVPTVCKDMGVSCLNLRGFLERVGWRY